MAKAKRQQHQQHRQRTKAASAAPAGNPSTPDLGAEFAHRLRDPFETTYMGVLRTNDPLLLERGHGGVELYRDLRRDGKVFAGLQKRQLALIGKDWQVQPRATDDAKACQDAEVVTSILKGFAFDKLCSELLQALLTGYVVAEIVWTVRDGLIVPERVVTRAQRRFVFVQPDENSPPQLHLLTRENMLTGVPVPQRKFIVHSVNPEDDNPYGTGLGLQLFWPVFFKRKGIVAWNKLCDRFGSPTPHGKYPRNASPKEKATLVDALRAMSNDGYLATPEGMEVALLEAKLAGNVTTQQQLCEYMDAWIAEVLTGQEPARTGGGGALAAAAQERQNVRQDLTQADSDLLSETLNETLIAWICEYNGLQPCHVYRQIQEEQDRKTQAEADLLVQQLGFDLDEATGRAKYGEGWHKQAKAAPVPLPAPTSGLPASFAEAKVANPTSMDAALDAAIAYELADWQPLLTPMTDPLQTVLDEARHQGWTAQQVIEHLPQALAQMDTTALTAALSRLMFAAAASEAGASV